MPLYKDLFTFQINISLFFADFCCFVELSFRDVDSTVDWTVFVNVNPASLLFTKGWPH